MSETRSDATTFWHEGYLGLGNGCRELAEQHFNAVLELDHYHAGAVMHKQLTRQLGRLPLWNKLRDLS